MLKFSLEKTDGLTLLLSITYYKFPFLINGTHTGIVWRLACSEKSSTFGLPRATKRKTKNRQEYGIRYKNLRELRPTLPSRYPQFSAGLGEVLQ